MGHTLGSVAQGATKEDALLFVGFNLVHNLHLESTAGKVVGGLTRRWHKPFRGFDLTCCIRFNSSTVSPSVSENCDEGFYGYIASTLPVT